MAEGNNIKLIINLPEDNFITQYMKFQESQYDGYPEWNFAGAISLLSIAVDRQLRMQLKLGTFYTNIWFFGIGHSTTSRKTTSQGQSEKFTSFLGLDKYKLPNSFSPESFIEQLTLNPHRYFWKDEAAGLLAAMEKSYMADMRDLFCELYECKEFKRTLRTSQRKNEITEFLITEPYISMWLLTTPDSLAEYVKPVDITSGWLLRYLYLNPSYEKEFKPFTPLEEEDIQKQAALSIILQEKVKKVKPMDMTLSKDAWKYFEDWQRERETGILKQEDNIAQALFGRYEVYAIKLAMLFEFGQKDFGKVLKEPIIDTVTGGVNQPAIIQGSEIQLQTIKESCRLIDEYFLPTAKHVISKLQESEHMRLVNRTKEILSRQPDKTITKAKLLQNLGLPTKEVNQILGYLVQSEEAIILVSGKAQIITMNI